MSLEVVCDSSARFIRHGWFFGNSYSNTNRRMEKSGSVAVDDTLNNDEIAIAETPHSFLESRNLECRNLENFVECRNLESFLESRNLNFVFNRTVSSFCTDAASCKQRCKRVEDIETLTRHHLEYLDEAVHVFSPVGRVVR